MFVTVVPGSSECHHIYNQCITHATQSSEIWKCLTPIPRGAIVISFSKTENNKCQLRIQTTIPRFSCCPIWQFIMNYTLPVGMLLHRCHTFWSKLKVVDTSCVSRLRTPDSFCVCISFSLPRLPKFPSQYYSNRLGNLDSNTDIQP